VSPARPAGVPGREAELLRIFLGESDHIDGRPAYERVVEEARRAGLAGATVLRGSLGFGANSVLHRPNAFRLSGDLPLVIEIVDEAAAVDRFVSMLEGLLRGGGLITRERVSIVRYAASDDDG
jgi:hypothetical protein